MPIFVYVDFFSLYGWKLFSKSQYSYRQVTESKWYAIQVHIELCIS